jgi:hypothetical protein
LLLSLPIAVSTLLGSAIPLLVGLLLVLPVLILAQRRLPPSAARSRGPELVAPWRLALAVAVVTVAGSLVAVVLALFLNGVGVGGSGGTLLEGSLAVCILVPCFLLGTLCQRWWVFTGSLPMLGLLLVSPSVLLLSATAATSCALALGSLHRRAGR